MNLPLPVMMVVSAGNGENDGTYEVHLNRSGINSIDLPREKIVAEIGGSLRMRFLNRGAPIHITITSPNAGMYSDFFHENMYVVDESVLTLPVRKECQEGLFDLEIISGYGGMKSQLQVTVDPTAKPPTGGSGRIPPPARSPRPAPSPDDHDGNCTHHVQHMVLYKH